MSLMQIEINDELTLIEYADGDDWLMIIFTHKGMANKTIVFKADIAKENEE